MLQTYNVYNIVSNICTSVRHSHDDRLDAESRGRVDDLFHSRNQNLAALQTETLLRRPFLSQEVLKSVHK